MGELTPYRAQLEERAKLLGAMEGDPEETFDALCSFVCDVRDKKPNEGRLEFIASLIDRVIEKKEDVRNIFWPKRPGGTRAPQELGNDEVAASMMAFIRDAPGTDKIGALADFIGKSPTTTRGDIDRTHAMYARRRQRMIRLAALDALNLHHQEEIPITAAISEMSVAADLPEEEITAFFQEKYSDLADFPG